MIKYDTIDEHNEGQRLDNYLIKTLKGVPRSKIYSIIRKGEVRVNKGRKKVHYKLLEKDVIRIPPITTNPVKQISPNTSIEQMIHHCIIYEDEGLFILNKPTGLAVHSGSGVNHGLIEYVKSLYSPNYELAHRIDRSTSGIIVIAKKRSVLKHLHEQLTTNKVKKYYSAIVKNSWAKKSHYCDAPLLTTHNKTLVNAKGKEAVSIFTPLKNFNYKKTSLSLVNVEIQSGRNHQIRVHSSYLDHPILGDNKYGDFTLNKQLNTKRMYLHSRQMSFINPLSLEELTITCEPEFNITHNDK